MKIKIPTDIIRMKIRPGGLTWTIQMMTSMSLAPRLMMIMRMEMTMKILLLKFFGKLLTYEMNTRLTSRWISMTMK